MIVTVPVLEPAPASKLNTAFEDNVVNCAGCTATVTVNAAVETGDTVALTVAVPPFSVMDEGDTTSVTTGREAVLPVPEADQSLGVSPFSACTCTS